VKGNYNNIQVPGNMKNKVEGVNWFERVYRLWCC